MAQWNPWHGCQKISAGCQNCYVYRIDSAFDRDASLITKTAAYNLPLKKRATAGINSSQVKPYILVLVPIFSSVKLTPGVLMPGG